MNSVIHNMVQVQLRQLYEFDFQKFVIVVMRTHYGDKNIQEIRMIRDGGADCLVESEQICIACYAPAKESGRKPGAIAKKINSDFTSYQQNWQSTYPCWHFYTNLDISPESIKQVSSLEGNCRIFGLEGIAAFIERNDNGQRPFPDRYRLYKALGIAEEYITRDFLENLFADLIHRSYEIDHVDYGSSAPEIAAKIRINSRESDQIAFQKMVENSIFHQQDIRDALSAYDDRDINTIKNRILTDYQRIAGDSEYVRMLALVHLYEEKYNRDMRDDELAAYISALIWYVFSQCLIGNTPADKEA